MQFVIQQLRPTDRLSVISYNDDVDVDLPLTLMTGSANHNSAEPTNEAAAIAAAGANNNRNTAIGSLNSIRCHGATNLSGGLLAAMEQLQEGHDRRRNRVPAIMFFTDGLANRGAPFC